MKKLKPYSGKRRYFLRRCGRGAYCLHKKRKSKQTEKRGVGVMIFAKINIITKKILKTREAGKKNIVFVTKKMKRCCVRGKVKISEQ